MEVLWAPWRMDYIRDNQKEKQCIFCPMENRSDEERLILFRTAFSTVMLNIYPYSYAHLMVAPVRHTADLGQLETEERVDLFQNMVLSIEVMKKVLRPSGFNVGLNLGQVAGAGILQHLHFHAVPRWEGDSNFMPVLADVRIIPEHLNETYRRLRPAFQKRGRETA